MAGLAQMVGLRISAGFALATAMIVTFSAATSAEAQDAKMALCSARQHDLYYVVAEYIGQSLRKPGLEVQVIETRGSLDNINRMVRGDCDAAIVQRDALMIHAMHDVSRRLKIAAPITLGDELLHLVCRRESGIEDVGNLLSNPERYTLLTGEPDSGSETTWRALTGLDRNYAAVGTRPLGGPEALAALAGGEAADCMMVVTARNAPFMIAVNERGDDLRLVPVDLFQFRDAELVENRIYRSAVIPAGTYKKLQAGFEPSKIETIAIEALPGSRQPFWRTQVVFGAKCATVFG